MLERENGVIDVKNWGMLINTMKEEKKAYCSFLKKKKKNDTSEKNTCMIV